jgi:hypothetical protein
MWQEMVMVYPGQLTHDMPQRTKKKDGKLDDSSLVGCYTTLIGKQMLKDEGMTILPHTSNYLPVTKA